MSDVISESALRALVEAWLKQGKQVAGPTVVKPGLVQYAKLESPEQLALAGFIHPANSIKDFVFPRHEKLFTYKDDGQELTLTPTAVPTTERIIVAARPCDAASLPILDKVFNWDTQDASYNARRAATTIVSLACTEWDSQCFCTSVGLGPASERGSDVLLKPLAGSAEFEVAALTEKGKALFTGKTAISEKRAEAVSGPAAKVDLDAVSRFLKTNYENPAWKQMALRCLGCGACTYSCPTCHCFDIVDEGNAARGCRVKNWDACQFGMFTLHASGHNPRPNQGVRQRQRLQHKFNIYPEKFGEILCTGCGNCTRNCPVALGVLTLLRDMAVREGAARTTGAAAETHEGGRA